MAAKRRGRAIARATARIQRNNPSYTYEGPSIISNSGIKFTIAERDRLEALKQRAEENRQKMIDIVNPLPHKIAGDIIWIDEGAGEYDTVENTRIIGREVDFVLAKKDKTIHDFKTKEAFDRYVNRLEYIAQDNYIPDRIRLYKRNFCDSLLATYGKEAKDIVYKIRFMKPEEYMKMVESDEALEIGYYGDSDEYIEGLLNDIRRALGMKEKEEYHDEHK